MNAGKRPSSKRQPRDADSSRGGRGATGTASSLRAGGRIPLGIVIQAAVLAVILGLASGCASMKVHPWDRDLLAEKKMQFNPDPVLTGVDDHIYFSKEGSTGGQDAAGGGCGCN